MWKVSKGITVCVYENHFIAFGIHKELDFHAVVYIKYLLKLEKELRIDGR